MVPPENRRTQKTRKHGVQARWLSGGVFTEGMNIDNIHYDFISIVYIKQ